MSDFVGRLLREPGPRLRPLLPNVFDTAAPRLQTDSDSVPPVSAEQHSPALAGREPHASTPPTPGPGPQHEPDTAPEPRAGQGPEPRTAAPEAEQGPRTGTADGTTPGRPLPRAASRTTDVTEALLGPGLHTDGPRAHIAPRRAPAPQPDAGLTLDNNPRPGPRPRSPLAPAASTGPGSDAPPGPSATLASGTPTRPTTTPGATTTRGAVGTGDPQVVAEPKNRSSPTPKWASADRPRSGDRSHSVVQSEARVAAAQVLLTSAQSDGPAPGDERVSPAATDTPEPDLTLHSGPPFAHAARPSAPVTRAHISHAVRPAVTPIAATARPTEGRAPGTPMTAEPVVRITIDRLEVRAAAPPAVAPRSTPRRPQLSLDEYLRGRS